MIWDVAEPFVQQVEVKSEHMDEYGHTNNVSYLKWLEDVSWAHSKAKGFGIAEYRQLGVGVVVRRHELDYLAPTYLGDSLHVATWIAENNGKVDLWRGYQVIRASDQLVVLRARTQWVCINMATGRPRRQPAEFKEAYRPVSTLV